MKLIILFNSGRATNWGLEACLDLLFDVFPDVLVLNNNVYFDRTFEDTPSLCMDHL